MSTISEALGTVFGRGDALEPQHRAEVVGRQTQVVVRILALANLANIASIVLTAGFMIPPGPFRNWWGFVMLATISNSCRIWWPWVVDPHRPAPRSGRKLLIVDVMAGALLYALLAIHVLPKLHGAEQLALTATLIGVIGAGAIALAAVRGVALAWVVTTLLGVGIGFVIVGADKLLLELVQLVLYALALAAAIEYLSWSFEQRYTAERKAATALETAEHALETVSLVLDDFEGGARDWLWHTDAAGTLVSPSARFAETSGIDATALEQKTMLDVVGGAEELGAALSAGQTFRDVVVPVDTPGGPRWWALSGSPRADGSWRGVGSDVTDSYEQSREIQHLANYDALTGLANRHRLRGDLQDLVARRGPHQRICFAILDLDNFKAVNDTLGHPTGDRLLLEVARRLRRAVPADRTCARLGGDEFAVVALVDGDDGDDVLDAAGLLEAVFRRPYLVGSARLEMRGSIGYAEIPGDAGDGDEVMMLADLALYSAKEGGRGRVSAFEPSMRTQAEVRARSVDDIRHAIEHREFEVYFQPIVDGAGRIAAFEALARWRHPDLGWIPPSSFIPVAEETGLIVPLGEQVLDQAVEMVASLPEHIRVAVNVSAVQLVSAGFAHGLRRVVERWGVSADRVDIEITESIALDPAARAVLAEIRRFGCGVAVDDFGTGYSSFASLQDMPITQIKVDRAFINRLDVVDGVRARVIVEAIASIASAMGLTCVAEGVETEAQLRIVRELGCSFVQGYVESRPMPADDVHHYLVQRGA